MALRFIAALLCWSVVASPLTAEEVPALYGKPAAEVVSTKGQWSDAARRRDVPYLLVHPKVMTDPCPVVLLSHGLGGTREGLAYIAEHLAGQGYIAVSLQHPGSDLDAAREGDRLQLMRHMRQLAANPRLALDRALDVRFVLDELDRASSAEGPLKGKLDMTRVAIAGHSFGAWTALAAAGLSNNGLTLGDKRIKCAVVLSPPVVSDAAKQAAAYGSIRVPTLYMTGTHDTSPINDTTPEQREIPFKQMQHADSYLIVLKDGDHMVFGGRIKLLRNQQRDELHHRLILASTTAFLDAYLRGEQGGLTFLREGMVKAMDGNGRYEQKIHQPVKP